MINPNYFTDRALQVEFEITLDSHHFSHANSKIVIKINYSEFGNESRYTNKIIKALSVVHVRIINQYKFKHQTVFSAKFGKQDEGSQVLNETDLFNNLYFTHNLTETDNNKIDIKSPLEQQAQNQELKDSG